MSKTRVLDGATLIDTRETRSPVRSLLLRASIVLCVALVLTGTPNSGPSSAHVEEGPGVDVLLPSRETTGPVAGSVLKAHYGDITVRTAGAVLENLDVHGFITVEAPNVTIRNSIVRGGKATYNRGAITNYGYDNLLVEDVAVLPAHETVWQDGVKGWDFTLNRVYVTGNVDSVKVHGEGNVLIKNSLLENTVYYASDPNQGGGATHNDGVQILGGSNIRIINNTIRGQQNMPVLGAANKSNTTGLVVDGNWLDGGHCTSKFEEMNGYHLVARVTNNKFGPNRKVASCKIAATQGTELTDESGNVMESTGQPVTVYRAWLT